MRTALWTVLPLLFVVTACADDSDASLRRAQDLLAAEKYEEAYAEYRRVEEETHNPLSQFTLGLFYKFGWGRPEDPAAAADWFEKAAAGGIPTAQHFHAEALASGVHRQPDPARAAEWYLKAGEAGHLLSFVSLAEMYLEGRGVTRDDERALQYCLRAATQAVVPAQVRVGRLYLEGRGAPRDVAQARRWFEEAASRENAEAEYYLGVIAREAEASHDHEQGSTEHTHGEGHGAHTDGEARAWFERAASRGYVLAYYPTGILYLGEGSTYPEPGDLAKAYLWLSAAAARVTDPAQKALIDKSLARVLEIMPPQWKTDLDKKVQAHLKEFAD